MFKEQVSCKLIYLNTNLVSEQVRQIIINAI